MALADLSTIPKRTDTLRILEVRILNALRAGVTITGGSAASGAGSPEGVVTANPGTTYYDTVSGFFYVKETGVGNTGWTVLIS